MEVRSIKTVNSYITKDGSEIFELFHPNNSAVENMSLAIARVDSGKATIKHKHIKSQEIYYILKGRGIMHIESESTVVKEGDCIFIPPGSAHWIENISGEELLILCASSPAYSHEDTILQSP